MAKRGNPKWVKGVSGNPRGRVPRAINLQKVMCEILDEDASEGAKMTKLQALCRKVINLAFQGESWAFKETMDRAFGRAMQSIEASCEVEHTSGDGLTVADLDLPLDTRIAILEAMKDKAGEDATSDKAEPEKPVKKAATKKNTAAKKTSRKKAATKKG